MMQVEEKTRTKVKMRTRIGQKKKQSMGSFLNLNLCFSPYLNLQ